MANITNQSKNSSVITNVAKTSLNDTWDGSTFSWDGAGQSTWDVQYSGTVTQTKNISSVTNQTKN